MAQFRLHGVRDVSQRLHERRFDVTRRQLVVQSNSRLQLDQREQVEGCGTFGGEGGRGRVGESSGFGQLRRSLLTTRSR